MAGHNEYDVRAGEIPDLNWLVLLGELTSMKYSNFVNLDAFAERLSYLDRQLKQIGLTMCEKTMIGLALNDLEGYEDHERLVHLMQDGVLTWEDLLSRIQQLQRKRR